VDDIDNRPVVSNSSATIEFNQDNRVGGNASCNRFAGSYVLSGLNLSFGQLATTKRMCTGPLMEQENHFLDALSQVTGLRFEQGRLFLLDCNGSSLIKASRKKEAM
jgi:heat shock protein HslJ